MPAFCAAARLELRKELVDELVARVSVPFGEAEVLVHGEAGEHIAVLGHVADPAAHDLVRPEARQLLAGERDRAAARDEPHHRPQRRRLPDAVAAEEGGHAAFGDVERDPLEHMRLAEVDVKVVDPDQRLRDAHRGSPRYAV